MRRHRLQPGPLRGPEHALRLAFDRGLDDWIVALVVTDGHVTVHWITTEASLGNWIAEQDCERPKSLVAVYRARHPAARMAEANRLVEALTAAEATVLRDLLIVGRGRWWSYQCEDKACCPPTGRRLPHGVTDPEPSQTVGEVNRVGGIA